MVNERLVWYLENNGLLAKQQCGYRSNRSTVDHLVRLETFVRDAFIHNQHLVAVFFDLPKAYDTTWKYGILKDLHNMGLRGNLPIFIGNFLSDRIFQIHLGTILSDKIFHQEEGVPQGAILSTTLFNVKINDIVKQVDPGVECSLYVDDFVIMYRSITIDAIQRKLQHTINRLEKWTLENGFTISKNKTVAMHFCPDIKCMDPVLKLDNDPIQFVKEAKFLGLIWDTKLTFEPHIKYLKARCQKSLNILKVPSRADQTTLLKLLLCRSWGACVPRRSQRLCQLEFWLLVGTIMLDRLWARGQTKCNTLLMLATSVFGRILLTTLLCDVLVKVQAGHLMAQWRGMHGSCLVPFVMLTPTILRGRVPSWLRWWLGV